MKRMQSGFVILLFVLIPFFSGCENKQVQEENANLKKQVETLAKEKGALQASLDNATKEAAARAAERETFKKQVDDLMAQMDELKAKMTKKPAMKAPAKKK